MKSIDLEPRMSKPMVEHLGWDSEFFGYGVGAITASNNIKLTLESINAFFENSKNRLVYLFSEDPLLETSVENEKHTFFFADIKQTYYRNLLFEDPLLFGTGTVSPYGERYPNSQLIELALQSGIYSRFYLDPMFSKNKFVEMYSAWIKKSTNFEIADEVLVSRLAGNLAGVVTLKCEATTGSVGLIAVDAMQRNKGIGRELIYSAFLYFISKGLNYIKVVTQGRNLSAVNLYKKCGFELEKQLFVYHVWKASV